MLFFRTCFLIFGLHSCVCWLVICSRFNWLCIHIWSLDLSCCFPSCHSICLSEFYATCWALLWQRHQQYHLACTASLCALRCVHRYTPDQSVTTKILCLCNSCLAGYLAIWIYVAMRLPLQLLRRLLCWWFVRTSSVMFAPFFIILICLLGRMKCIYEGRRFGPVKPYVSSSWRVHVGEYSGFGLATLAWHKDIWCGEPSAWKAASFTFLCLYPTSESTSGWCCFYLSGSYCRSQCFPGDIGLIHEQA